MQDFSQREMIYREPSFKAHVDELKKAVDLGEAWQAIFEGRGSKEQGQLVLVDLMLETGYFGVAPPDATGDMLQRREGKREVMARIFFLADMPSSFITKLRRDALDELQKAEERALHDG